MVTHRCRWCGEVYMPKAGAIRSFYCSRSHRDKYNRWLRKFKANRRLAMNRLHKFDPLRYAGQRSVMPAEFRVALVDILGLVPSADHQSAQRFIIRLLEAYEPGSTMQ